MTRPYQGAFLWPSGVSLSWRWQSRFVFLRHVALLARWWLDLGSGSGACFRPLLLCVGLGIHNPVRGFPLRLYRLLEGAGWVCRLLLPLPRLGSSTGVLIVGGIGRLPPPPPPPGPWLCGFLGVFGDGTNIIGLFLVVGTLHCYPKLQRCVLNPEDLFVLPVGPYYLGCQLLWRV